MINDVVTIIELDETLMKCMISEDNKILILKYRNMNDLVNKIFYKSHSVNFTKSEDPSMFFQIEINQNKRINIDYKCKELINGLNALGIEVNVQAQ